MLTHRTLNATRALKTKLLSQAIADPLFLTALHEAASEIGTISRAAPNEATIEGAFERVLYAVLKDVGITFHPGKELPLRTRRHVAKGRTDSRIGTLVIEYKQPSALSSSKAIGVAEAQLSDYIDSISLDETNETVGFLTDGTRLLELRSSDGETTSRSGLTTLDDKGLLRITRAIAHLQTSALTASNLIRDFCGDSHSGMLFDVARALYELLTHTATVRTRMLQAEWEALFRLAHDDQSQQKRIEDRRKALSSIFDFAICDPAAEYRCLFALHTAYAIILKLISFRVVADIRFTRPLVDYRGLLSASSGVLQPFCARLEDGDLFRQIGIINLLEGDFFSWYADEDQWNPAIANGVRNILSTLARYEDVKSVFDARKAVDLFRSLYEATVPQVVRGSFGEFYTPYWLAEHVLRSSYCDDGWSVIDPCCGSGTFLIAAISKLRQELELRDSSDIASEVLSRVYGIDLNPLAVLTARVHYFIHIADLVENLDGSIVIPVFLGDASNVPGRKKVGGVEFVRYELVTLKSPLSISLPLKMAKDTRRFVLTMLEFERRVKLEQFGEAKRHLISAADDNDNPAVRRDVGALADAIIDLEKKSWNGIWARIIANFISTACVGRFTNVIGNPPWIDWKSLPAGYREKVKSLCIDRGLFSGAGRTGGINLNVCALITHVAAANWLKNGGYLAFLMPKELTTQASYEGWRRSVGGANFSLVELHDWSGAGHPFDPVKEDFMTFIFHGRPANQQFVPVWEFAKATRSAKAHLWANLEEAEENLDASKKVAGQIIQNSTSYTIAGSRKDLDKFRKIAGVCSYVGREGIEFYPQELMLFHYDAPGPKKGSVWVRNIQVQKSKYRIPQQRILVETKFLFPLVKGPGIVAFEYDDPGILVSFPYRGEQPHAPISQEELAKESPLLLDYYRRFRKQLEQQTKYSDSIRGDGEFYGVARTGPYSFRDCYVAFRDNTNWCACVVTQKRMPWGERKRYLFQNHAVSICERNTGAYIDGLEASFVAGIFNTRIVREFVHASSDNRSFKIRPPIFVPLYDPKDALHREISALYEAAVEMPSERNKFTRALEEAYLKICARRD